MYYIVYKTINLVNKKFYIGKHNQHIDPYQFDGYYGSGAQIISAVKKYGKENFIRETLFVFDSESDCLLKEEEIVAPHLGKPYCYNMRSGGVGGFDHINSLPKEQRSNIKAYKQKVKSGEIKVGGTQNWTDETWNKVRQTGWGKLSKQGLVNPNSWEGLTEDQRKERSEHLSNKLSGSNNGSYGKKWCVKYDADDLADRKLFQEVPEGWITTSEWKDNKKNKTSNAYGRRWYNNGVENFYLKSTDDTNGLVKGRLRINNCCGFK